MEIRRIQESEGEAVAALWDRMCREAPDGAPLTARGRRNLSRMLAGSAWHRDAFCLVAVDGDRILGFANGRVTIADGLLPGLVGEIDTLYVVPEKRGEGVSRALAEAAVQWLSEQGADPIRHLCCAEAAEDHRFWRTLGFQPDMVCLSRYRDA